MTTILPWMPATALVLGLDVNLCRHVANKSREKTSAAAAKLLAGEKPRPWGPLNIEFIYEGQKIKFVSNAYVGQPDNGIMLTLENETIFLEGKKEMVFTIWESVEVFFPLAAKRKAGEPPRTTCGIDATIATDIPESLAATLPGRTLGELVDFPGAFNQAIGQLEIRTIQDRRLSFDTRAIEAHAAQLHRDFQATIKD